MLITTPATSHRELAKLLSPYLTERSVILLNPGRCFGAAEFRRILDLNKAATTAVVAETETILYTCRRQERRRVRLYALKNDVRLSSPSGKNPLVRLPVALGRFFRYEPNYLAVTLNNIGAMLHVAPVLLNIGLIEQPKLEFDYYYEAITPTIAKVIEKLDTERLMVGRLVGASLDSLPEWLGRMYGTRAKGIYAALGENAFYRNIPAPKTLQHRYLWEDIPFGLVALESVACYYHQPTPAITKLIELGELILGCDYRKQGTKYDELLPYLK